jgi:CheY-like chemotaxis protein
VAVLFHPSIVFLDLAMPGTDGLQVLAELRQLDDPVAHAFFVCLTGKSGAAEEQACLDAGFDRFVTKPMEANVLRGILAEAHQRGAAAARLG